MGRGARTEERVRFVYGFMRRSKSSAGMRRAHLFSGASGGRRSASAAVDGATAIPHLNEDAQVWSFSRLLQATSLESHQKWPSRRGWISKLHVISKLHYKYHSTELKQLVRCGFSDPTIFSSCRNNARISVQLSNYPVRRSPFCTRKLVNQVP